MNGSCDFASRVSSADNSGLRRESGNTHHVSVSFPVEAVKWQDIFHERSILGAGKWTVKKSYGKI